MIKNKHYHQELTLYYYRYKGFILPFIITVTCLILFVAIVIPELQHFISVRNQVSNENNSLQILEQNFQRITSLNDEQLNAQFQLASSALPAEKDVISILNTISSTASKANVSLQDYNFQVGELTANSGESGVKIDLSINGDVNSIQQFIHGLKTSLPLSNVTSVRAGSDSTFAISVNFFTKPFTKSSFDENSPLQLLSTQDQQTLDTLASWEKSQ